jgi:hypothetical protein
MSLILPVAKCNAGLRGVDSSGAIRAMNPSLCLEVFWRNARWELLSLHLSITSLSNNGTPIDDP